MILFNDFKAHVDAIRPELDAAINRVLDSGWFVLGPELEAFETELADYLGIKHVVGVNSGTDAISLALTALDVGPGDEVVTTAMTAFPTITGIHQAGALPVVADIDSRTGLLDPAAAAARVTERTKAIVPVHLYGQCCDMDAIMRLADEHGLLVVEDCAQAIGACWCNQPAGAFGKVAAFSFYPTKNLGALGDGGAAVTDDDAIAERLRSLRNCGQKERYIHLEPGRNSRLDEIQAAILRVKLEHLDEWTRRRTAIAETYRQHLPSTACLVVQPDATPVHHLFPILVDERDTFMEQMRQQEIQTLIHYPVPVHLQAGFPGASAADCPTAEAFAKHVVSLPVAPELSDAAIDHICRCVLRNL